MLLLFLACAHLPPPISAEVRPVLPAPRADVYTRMPGVPRDPLIASVAGGLPWDEALSGAATGVALAELAGEHLTLCDVRWKGVLAGYPFPIRGWLSASVPRGEVPTRLVEEARLRAKGAVDVGLVRARSGETDRWVLVVADRRAELPTVPREVELGHVLALGGADWFASDPFGKVQAVSGSIRLDVPGEWLLAARVGGATVASLPVYVGETTPVTAPVACGAGEGTNDLRTQSAISGVRAAYAFPALAHDTALDSVARARLRVLVAGGELPDPETQLRSAGYLDVAVAAATCQAETVEACVATIWWSPEGRAILVGDLADYGYAIEEQDGQVRLMLLASG